MAPAPIAIYAREAALCRDIPLVGAWVGGEAVQPGCLGVVLRDPRAILVRHPAVALSVGVPLVGGEAASPGCLGGVMCHQRDAGAILVHHPEVALRDPKITVGDQTVQAKGTLSTYDQFTLDHNGTFTIYDSAWHFISNCSVGAFHPTNLTSFAMAPAVATAQPVWLEVGVSGSKK